MIWGNHRFKLLISLWANATNGEPKNLDVAVKLQLWTIFKTTGDTLMQIHCALCTHSTSVCLTWLDVLQ